MDTELKNSMFHIHQTRVYALMHARAHTQIIHTDY